MQIYCVLCFIIWVRGQVRISPYTAYPDLQTNLGPIDCLKMNPTATQFYLCQNDTIFHFNISAPSILYKKGECIWSRSAISSWKNAFAVQNFIIGSTVPTQNPKVFNLFSYTQNSALPVKEHIVASQVLVTKNFWISGNTAGELASYQLSTFPSGPRKSLNLESPSNMFISKSPDQNLFSVSYQTLIKVKIFDSSTLTLLKQLALPNGTGGVRATFFSSDSEYLFVFPYNLGYFLVYSKILNWIIVGNVTTGYVNVENCVLYGVTDQALCWSSLNQVLFSIKWRNGCNLRVQMGSLVQKRLGFSDNGVFLVSNLDYSGGKFYQLDADCSSGQFYDTSSKGCVICSPSCLSCSSSRTCGTCMGSKIIVNGKCETCKSSEIFNSTTQTCIKISLLCSLDLFYNVSSQQCVSCVNFCVKCVSTTVCTECASGYQLINNTCIICNSTQTYNINMKLCDPSSNCQPGNFYVTASQMCVPCVAKCARCATKTICIFCRNNYTLVNNTCVACAANQLYNYNTMFCDNIQTLCTGDEYFNVTSKTCVQCLPNCAKCLTTTSCSYCANNYAFINSTCLLCESNQLYNITTKLCDDIATFCSGDQYFSIPLLKCVQCLPNCGKCSSITSCEYCAGNYSLFNGVCRPCGVNEVYNSSTKICIDFQSNCQPRQFFDISIFNCVQCMANCAKCSSAASCESCDVNFMLDNGTCRSCTSNEVYNSLTQACEIIPVDVDRSDSSEDILKTSVPQQTFKNLMSLTMKNQGVQTGNAVPGNRVLLSPIFSFFCNFDHLWLYVYHKRKYGVFVDSFLKSIRNLEETKWNSVSESFLTNYLHLNWTILGSRLNFKKFVGVITFLLFFIFCWYMASWYMIVKAKKADDSKYFFGNYYPSFKNLMKITFESNLLNFCLGACHILLENQYNKQMAVLAFLELIYVFLQIKSISKRDTYRFKYIGWQNIISSVLRIQLIASFCFDQQTQQKNLEIFNSIEMVTLVTLLSSMLVSITINLFIRFFQIWKAIFGEMEFHLENVEQAKQSEKIRSIIQQKLYSPIYNFARPNANKSMFDNFYDLNTKKQLKLKSVQNYLMTNKNNTSLVKNHTSALKNNTSIVKNNTYAKTTKQANFNVEVVESVIFEAETKHKMNQSEKDPCKEMNPVHKIKNRGKTEEAAKISVKKPRLQRNQKHATTLKINTKILRSRGIRGKAKTNYSMGESEASSKLLSSSSIISQKEKVSKSGNKK